MLNLRSRPDGTAGLSKPKDAAGDSSSYSSLYEELGQKQPKTEFAYKNRRVGSRYWTVMQELKPFAMASKKLIDLGCNDGIYTIPYCKAGGEALGVDISSTLVQKASTSAQSHGLRCRFIQGEIDSPRLPERINESFEVALFTEVLEHLQRPDVALENVRKLLAEGGHLLLTTPTPIFNGAKFRPRYFHSVVVGRKLLESNAIDTRAVQVDEGHRVEAYVYRHDGYYPRALVRYVEGFGFKVQRFYTFAFAQIGGLNLFGLRRIPIINLFGSTNVGIFSRRQ